MSDSRTDDRPVIVVADDDRSIRFGLACFLEAEGFRVVEAQDGAEALKAIEREGPSAVLLDLKMPNVDGLAVLAELGPKLSDLPVIVVTAYGGSAAAIKAMRSGAYDYLTKPFDLDEVGLTLKRALDQKALTEEVKALRAKSQGATRKTTRRMPNPPSRRSWVKAPPCETFSRPSVGRRPRMSRC